MSTPAERGDDKPPTFLHNFVRTLAFMLVCGIVGPLFIFFYFAFGRELGTGWMLWSGIAVTILDVGIAAAIAVGRTASQQRTHRLQRVGRRGVAEVLAADSTGVQINDQPLLDLHVRIHVEGLAPFEVRKKSVVSYLHTGFLSAGQVPVLVDPETLEWEFDWNAARPRYQPQAMAAPFAPTPVEGRSVADRLAELDSLLQRDLIGPEEYDEKRRRIIDGI